MPQRSILGPFHWNIHVDDLLQLLPAVRAYADDCTLSYSYSRQDSGRVADAINEQLRVIEEWGARWQVTFALEKTQVMVCFWSPTDTAGRAGRLFFLPSCSSTPRRGQDSGSGSGSGTEV